MKSHEPIALKREVEAIQIPYGDKIKLSAGMTVEIYQVLGGNYTVITERGMMVRIDGKDADAIGQQPAAALPSVQLVPGQIPDKDQIGKLVMDQLRTCYDPEIPVNIVELGLVYEVNVTEHPGGGYRADVKMTLTAPGCGMGNVISIEAEDKIRSIPGVKEAKVEVVWDPPWDRSMMSDAAKLQLGMY
ncbi:MAG: putative Fe-S cluster assembly protein SufT [Planctomycetes bacterium]|nr:putative Fe-S cluster assembly protein SufT [Planctomycetota bacterium]